ncbi:glycosyltransferase [Hyphobacterium sp. CCMP332]|nr:glycosyltransferase [Hyphobacterium sp. CCMP332]
MNKSQTLVCHSFPSWDSSYKKSTVELMKSLAIDFNIVFLDYHYTWKDLLSKPNIPRLRILGLKSRFRKVQSKNESEILVFNAPPIFPIFKPIKKTIERYNQNVLSKSIKKLNARLKLEDCIYINAMNPKWADLRKYLSPKKSIYYSYDNIEAMKWAKEKNAEHESVFASKADLVITSSTALKNKFSTRSKRVLTVFNGFDNTLFNYVPTYSDSRLVSYLGSVDDRIDFELLRELLKSNKKLKFQFIGPVKSEKAHLLSEMYSNFILLGPKNQKDAAALIQKSAVCIIPFKNTEFTRYIYPLKINEYLAMAKPVVSTAFSEDILSFKKVIAIAQTSSEYNEAIKASLQSNKKQDINARIEFSAANTWQNRSAEFARAIAE